MTEEQAQEFFKALSDCPLDFHCILQLLITTGMRRGECLGIQWGDIDEMGGTITISRNVSYTPQSGIVVSTPKTTNSVRTIPIMKNTLRLLQQLKSQMQNQHPDTVLTKAFLFPKSNEVFFPRDPNSVTWRVKRFMKRNGFPDLSPHDLRHPYVKHKTKGFLRNFRFFQGRFLRSYSIYSIQKSFAFQTIST